MRSPSVELQNCAEWLQRDYAAVKAALTLPWSTGPVEDHINRLKLIKRSGYGRMQLYHFPRIFMHPAHRQKQGCWAPITGCTAICRIWY
jgi:transposase